MSNSKPVSAIPRKILSPIDFSAPSTTALATATDLARHFHAELVLVHVIPMLPPVSGADFFKETEYMRELQRDAEGRLRAMLAPILASGVTAESVVAVSGDTAGEILRVATAKDIDMIVIATHGMTGWRPMIFGSIAEKVVKLAHCPVLVIRAPNA
ncbi:MAG TPA: universal stress protein [Acidisarcina sp.]|nr:universal stress protein [Acidisarcina sp.]